MSHRSRQSGLNLGPDGSEARLCCSSNIFRTLLQASFISGFDGIANAGAGRTADFNPIPFVNPPSRCQFITASSKT